MSKSLQPVYGARKNTFALLDNHQPNSAERIDQANREGRALIDGFVKELNAYKQRNADLGISDTHSRELILTRLMRRMGVWGFEDKELTRGKLGGRFSTHKKKTNQGGAYVPSCFVG